MTYRRIRIGQIGDNKTICFAVQELVRYLKQMDSDLMIDVLMCDTVTDTFRNMIWVGTDIKLSPKVPIVENDLWDDAIAISVKDACGYITGSNERSILLAVYRFLRELGCAWIRPGKEGERIPSKILDKSQIQASVFEAASYRHRGVCIEGAVNYENVWDMIDYLPKVGMNEYYTQFFVPVEFFKRWYHHEWNSFFKAEEISREEIEGMVNSLEVEIAKRGICYHKTGHGWTCEPFGIDGCSWHWTEDYKIPSEVQACLAEVNGKREFWNNVPLNTNLCYSKKSVRDTMTDAIVEYCEKNPHVDVLHFWLADDVNNHCECEECAKKRPADWYVLLLNELDEKLTAASIDTRIVFLIYMDLLWEPVEELFHNSERFTMMFAPITRYYGKNYGEHLVYEDELPPYVRNQLNLPESLAQNLKQLRQWQSVYKGDSFAFEYHLMWAHVNDPGYEYCGKNLFEDVKDLDKIGLNGMMSCQVQRSFFPTGLPFYMMATALWDKSSEYEETASSYYRATYGKDGNLVHSYLQKVSDLILLYESPAHISMIRVEPPFCKDYGALRSEIHAFRQVIERNMAQVEAVYKEEWKLLMMHSEFLYQLTEILELLEEKKQDEAKAAFDVLMNYVFKNEMALQKVLDAHNTRKCLRRRLKLV